MQSEGRIDGTPPSDADAMAAMAYVDGELDASARAHLEERMQTEPALGRAVAEHRALGVLARRTAPPEPADLEWDRLRLEPWYRGTLSTGWVLVIVGTLLSLVAATWAIATNDGLHIGTRIVILGSLLGFLLLFLTVVARRLRTYELDPYRHVER